jgi:hypothetical protein
MQDAKVFAKQAKPDFFKNVRVEASPPLRFLLKANWYDKDVRVRRVFPGFCVRTVRRADAARRTRNTGRRRAAILTGKTP